MDDEKKLFIRLTSDANEALCIGVDDWPNNLGQVSGGGNRASLSAEGRTIPAADTDFGYCVGRSCILRIPPHQILTGFIGYKEFGDPIEIVSLGQRRLTYHVRRFICR